MRIKEYSNMNTTDFVKVDNDELKKYDKLIVAMFNVVDFANNSELDAIHDTKLEQLNAIVSDIASTINGTKLLWVENENICTWETVGKYFNYILTKNKLKFIDNRCYSYLHDALWEITKTL